MEDNLPMDNRIKLLFSIAIGVVVLSWTISLFTLVRQIWMGQAFSMDEEGIHSTATGTIIFALIFIIPVRTIPYSAIENISEESGVLTLHIDKAKIDMIPILRIFAEKRYHLFSGFTAEKQENINLNFINLLNSIRIKENRGFRQFYFSSQLQLRVRHADAYSKRIFFATFQHKRGCKKASFLQPLLIPLQIFRNDLYSKGKPFGWDYS